MPKYRAAIVGCGNRSRAHIMAYEHIPNGADRRLCRRGARTP